MQFPLLDLNQNFQFQKEVLEALKLTGQAYFYPSAAMAFQEVVSGYLQFVPHKKSIAVIKGNSDLINWVLPQFYRMNYNVQILALDQVEQLKTWMDGLKPDTSCVLFAEDHPITGEKLAFADDLKQQAQAKKIPIISLSYLAESLGGGDDSASYAKVFALPSGQSFVQTSSRFRFYANYHLTIEWTRTQIEGLVSEIQAARQAAAMKDPQRQHLREKDLPLGFQLLATANTSSINLFHPQISGSLLLDELEKQGVSGLPLTTHFCQHGSWTSFTVWWQACPHADILRNLICCPPSFYSSDDNWKKLQEAALKALRRQTWDK